MSIITTTALRIITNAPCKIHTPSEEKEIAENPAATPRNPRGEERISSVGGGSHQRPSRPEKSTKQGFGVCADPGHIYEARPRIKSEAYN
jgi:hypothetical protein